VRSLHREMRDQLLSPHPSESARSSSADSLKRRVHHDDADDISVMSEPKGRMSPLRGPHPKRRRSQMDRDIGHHRHASRGRRPSDVIAGVGARGGSLHRRFRSRRISDTRIYSDEMSLMPGWKETLDQLRPDPVHFPYWEHGF
jgi:hypothetical protein